MLGLIALGVRHGFKHRRGLPQGDSLWRFRYAVSFDAHETGAQIVGPIPSEPGTRRVFRQRLSHPGMRMGVVRQRHSPGWVLTANALSPGAFELQVDQDIHFAGDEGVARKPPAKEMDAEQRAYYLRGEPLIQVSDSVVRTTLARLRSGKASKERLAERIYEYCTANIAPAPEGAADAATTLREGAGTAKGRSRAMVALCRCAKIPAQLVAGFETRETDAAAPLTWIEVFLHKRWVPFDVDNEFKGRMPRRFLTVRRDAAVPVTARRGVTSFHVEYAMWPLNPSENSPVSLRRDTASILDLTQLPMPTRRVLALILLLPLGALITAFFRNVVGMQTFGTFTPSLIAMGFVYADVRVASVVFGLVVAMGLGGRFLVERMKLLMVPRLSVVLTLVVIVLAFSLSVLDYLNLELGSGSMLMPLVVLTMLIERVHVTEIEDGMVHTLRLLLQTLVVAFICYALLRWRSMGRLLVSFPELHCLTLAALLLVGRYSGYRLTELWRFRDFAALRSGGDG